MERVISYNNRGDPTCNLQDYKGPKRAYFRLASYLSCSCMSVKKEINLFSYYSGGCCSCILCSVWKLFFNYCFLEVAGVLVSRLE